MNLPPSTSTTSSRPRPRPAPHHVDPDRDLDRNRDLHTNPLSEADHALQAPPLPPPPTFSQAQMTSNLFHLMDTFGPNDDDFFSTDPDHLSSSDNDALDGGDQPGTRGPDVVSAAYHAGSSPVDAFDSNAPHVNLEDNQYLHHQLELSRAERELRELEQAAFTNLPNFLPGVFPGRVGAEQVSPERLKRYGVSAAPNDASANDTDDAGRANIHTVYARWAAAAGIDADDEMGHEGGTSEDQTSPTPAVRSRQQQQQAVDAAGTHYHHRHTASTSSLFSTPNQSTNSRNADHSLSPPRRPPPPLVASRPLAHSPTNSGNVSDREEEDGESSPSSSSTVRSTASGRVLLSPAARAPSPPRTEPAPMKKAATATTASKQVTRLDSAMMDQDSSGPITSRSAMESAADEQAEVGFGPQVQHHYLSSMVPTSRDMSPMPSLPPNASGAVGAVSEAGRVMALGTISQQNGADASLSAFAHYLAHHPHLHPLPVQTPHAAQATSSLLLSSNHAPQEPISANTGFHLSPMVLPSAAPFIRRPDPALPAPVTKPTSPMVHRQPTAVRTRAPALPARSPPTRSQRQTSSTARMRMRASPERIEPATAPSSITYPSSVTSHSSSSLNSPTPALLPEDSSLTLTTSIAHAVLGTLARLLPLNDWFASGPMDLYTLYARLASPASARPTAAGFIDRLLPPPAAVLALLVYLSATWMCLAYPPSRLPTTPLALALRGPRVFQALVLARIVRVLNTMVVRPLVYVLAFAAKVACVGSVGAVRATRGATGNRSKQHEEDKSAVGVLVGLCDSVPGRHKRSAKGARMASKAERVRKEVTVVEALAAVYRARHAWVSALVVADAGQKQQMEVPTLLVLVAEVLVVYLVAAAGWLDRDGPKKEGEIGSSQEAADGELGTGVWVVDVSALADRVAGHGPAQLEA
ncbi:hypothetical protein BCR44DRAFT_62544 [Catenaria anguillulae PL171]|uniref:Uncharacterized protein n=1 Tax=Catenaria anguillulae PL171 TaxID=765915 RepID=A0A1Y2HRR7_9FUNG|nr:hypothetical protein BCR44DRAFT_62544 [Catenaria anguillulae PL171]